MKHELFINGERYVFRRWGSRFDTLPSGLIKDPMHFHMQRRYFFDLPQGKLMVSIIVGAGTYATLDNDAHDYEVALLLNGEFIRPQVLRLPKRIRDYWDSDDVAIVPEEDIIHLLHLLQRRESRARA